MGEELGFLFVYIYMAGPRQPIMRLVMIDWEMMIAVMCSVGVVAAVSVGTKVGISRR